MNWSELSQSYGFSSSHVCMWELDHKESWVLKNWWFWIVVLQKTLESPLDFKEIQPVHPKEISPECSLEGLMLKLQPQYFGHLIRRTDSLKRPWCWERLKAGEGDNRGHDGWMASPTPWTWVWVNSGSWWWTGRPGMLWSMGLQRIGHDWTTELNWWLSNYLWQLWGQPSPFAKDFPPLSFKSPTSLKNLSLGQTWMVGQSRKLWSIFISFSLKISLIMKWFSGFDQYSSWSRKWQLTPQFLSGKSQG